MLTLVIVTQAFGHTVQACQESSRHHSYGTTSFQSHGADLSESQALRICLDTTGKKTTTMVMIMITVMTLSMIVKELRTE